MTGLIIQTNKGAVVHLDFPNGPAFSFDQELDLLNYLVYVETRLREQNKIKEAQFFMNIIDKERGKPKTGVYKHNLEIGYLYSYNNIQLHSFSGSKKQPFDCIHKGTAPIKKVRARKAGGSRSGARASRKSSS